MQFVLNCHPPTTTAQMKRVRVVNGKPRFFHGAKMQRQAQEWALLLRTHVPAVPMDGALELTLDLDYPHTRESARHSDYGRKITRPDVDGAAKHFIDLMATMGFFQNDSQIAELTVRKWHCKEPKIIVKLQPCL